MNVSPLGKPADRVEAADKLTGRAGYAVEFVPPNVAYAVVVGSLVPAGRVTGYDTAAAEKAPGVLAVVTPKNRPDLRPLPVKELFPTARQFPVESRPPLFDDTVYHVGQAVAVVVADTLERAAHAAELVRVAVQAARPALAADAARDGFDPDAFAGRDELQVRRGDADRALAGGAARVEHTYRTPVHTHHPIEPAGAVAAWDGDALTLHATTRNLHGARAMAAGVFGLPPDKVRVICPLVGGAFGSKGFTFQHDLTAALAAKAVGRPVKLVLTRRQMALLAGHRPETKQTVALAADKDGRLTALRHAVTSTTSPVADFVEPCGVLSAHLYACPNVTVAHRAVRLNRSSPVFMRAPGELAGTFALESALDELAVALALDPVRLRLANHSDRDAEKGVPWSSKHLKECYRLGAERFGWAKRAPKPRATRDGRWLVGSGMATAAYPGLRWKQSATVKLLADGTAIGRTASHEIGNGAKTVLARVLASGLGLPPDKVTVELGDSAFPFAPAAGGSQTTASGGAALLAAAAAAVAKLAAVAVADETSPLAGLKADAVAVRDGRLVADAGKGEPIAAALRRAGLKEVEAEATSEPGPEAKKFGFLSTGAVFVEVRVDADFGTVRVSRVVGVYDCGRTLNPKSAHSQLVGGVVMGLGAALSEATHYDPRRGQPVNPDLGDYLVPVAADTPPHLNLSFVDEPDPNLAPHGGRGVGEIGVTGIQAAVANAVYHATGVRVRELPVTADRLLTDPSFLGGRK